MSEMLSEKIRDLLAGSEIAQKVRDPETHRMVREGFTESFGKVKDRLGDSWEDVQLIYEMAFDDAFDMKGETKVAVLFFALKYAGPEIERYKTFKSGEAPMIADGEDTAGGDPA